MSLPHVRSSGDLTADRRYDYGVALLKDGDAAAAAELIEQALELASRWTVGWFTLGQAREAAGDRDGAIAAYKQARELDAEDSLGAGLNLARLGAVETPQTTAIAYVRDLFDDYAPRFDDALVQSLGYQAPALIARHLRAATGGQTFARCLDLGCGTGLMAAALDGIGAIDGVDLSPGMIAIAREKNLYAALDVAEAVAAMEARAPASYDLVTAADVFCYFGDLAPAFAAAARILQPTGAFAFSVERGDDSPQAPPFELADSLRFRHKRGHVEEALSRAGLKPLDITQATLRFDRGNPIVGLVVIAIRDATEMS